jgi:hypothetical protein
MQICFNKILNYVQHTIQTIGTHNTIKTLYLKYKENIILDNKTVKDIYLQLLELDKLTHKVELNYSYIDFKSIWATLCLVNTLYIREFIYKTIHIVCLELVGHHYKKVVSGISSVDIQNYHPRI